MRLRVGEIELFQDISDDLKFRIKIQNPTMNLEDIQRMLIKQSIQVERFGVYYIRDRDGRKYYLTSLSGRLGLGGFIGSDVEYSAIKIKEAALNLYKFDYEGMIDYLLDVRNSYQTVNGILNEETDKETLEYIDRTIKFLVKEYQEVRLGKK